MALSTSYLTVIKNNQAYIQAVSPYGTLQVTSDGNGNAVNSDICLFGTMNGFASTTRITQANSPTDFYNDNWISSNDVYLLAAVPIQNPGTLSSGENQIDLVVGPTDGENNAAAVTLSLTFSSGGQEHKGRVHGSEMQCCCSSLDDGSFVFDVFSCIGDNDYDTVTINANNSEQKDLIVNIYRGSDNALRTTIIKGVNNNDNLTFVDDGSGIYVVGFIEPSKSGNTLTFALGDPKTDAQVSITEIDEEMNFVKRILLFLRRFIQLFRIG